MLANKTMCFNKLLIFILQIGASIKLLRLAFPHFNSVLSIYHFYLTEHFIPVAGFSFFFLVLLASDLSCQDNMSIAHVQYVLRSWLEVSYSGGRLNWSEFDSVLETIRCAYWRTSLTFALSRLFDLQKDNIQLEFSLKF